MKIETFEMERMQSTWENLVEYDMSESGIMPLTLNQLVEMGLDMGPLMDVPLGYSQSNGTPQLKELLTKLYPGAAQENIEVTNGTSEANYLIALSQLRQGDQFALELPNYMQMWGVPRGLGAEVKTFHLRLDADWEPDWAEFDQAVNEKTRLVYVSHPNNPTGKVISDGAMKRIVKRCEQAGAYLISDEVYLGAEIDRPRTKSFWGMSDKVIVTSGLSKAYGIPGIRVGWIIGPAEVVYDCWTQHDYITIGPNKLSDFMARVAVTAENRQKCYARTRQVLRGNLPILAEWVAGFGGKLAFRPPDAGAIALIKYQADIPSVELVERIRTKQSTLIVPGAHFGLEGCVRVWMGGKPEFITEGYRRVGEELRRVL